jgi:hypothetical protein
MRIVGSCGECLKHLSFFRRMSPQEIHVVQESGRINSFASPSLVPHHSYDLSNYEIEKNETFFQLNSELRVQHVLSFRTFRTNSRGVSLH